MSSASSAHVEQDALQKGVKESRRDTDAEVQGAAHRSESGRLRGAVRGPLYRWWQEDRGGASGVSCGGGFGSTEILLRSARDHTLPLSQTLGSKFSTNGDFGAFAYKTTNPDS